MSSISSSRSGGVSSNRSDDLSRSVVEINIVESRSGGDNDDDAGDDESDDDRGDDDVSMAWHRT